MYESFPQCAHNTSAWDFEENGHESRLQLCDKKLIPVPLSNNFYLDVRTQDSDLLIWLNTYYYY
jgi:hypothetical protein